jgi:hypothetical protein
MCWGSAGCCAGISWGRASIAGSAQERQRRSDAAVSRGSRRPSSVHQRFSAGEAAEFAAELARVERVSVIGTGPGDGHENRDDWIATYGQMMRGEMAGTRLEGRDPRAYEDGPLGWAVDEPRFVFPDGSRLPTRLTAVLHHEHGDWKVIHLHLSVGVPDEQAMQLTAESAS